MSPRSWDSCFLLSSVRYRFVSNSCFRRDSCSDENAVLGRLSSTEFPRSGSSDFLIFLDLGPLDGLSEYLVQKTQAGHNCPLGPRTMPGGQSASVVQPSMLSDLELWGVLGPDKSTGDSEVGGLGDLGSFFTATDSIEFGDRMGGETVVGGDSLCPNSGLRIASIEKGTDLRRIGAIGREGRKG